MGSKFFGNKHDNKTNKKNQKFNKNTKVKAKVPIWVFVK